MKRIALLLIAFVLFAACIQAGAEGADSISFDTARNSLLANNRTLKNLVDSRQQALTEYTKSVARAADINTEGYTLTIGGQETFQEYDNYMKMLMTMQKELPPRQAKLNWENACNSYNTTQGSLIIQLRDIYANLLASDRRVKLEAVKIELADRSYMSQKAKFEQGLITRLQLEEEEYVLLSSQKQRDAALRDRDNACREMSIFLGADINTVYNDVKYDEKYKIISLKPVEYYVEKALKTRYEIVSLRKQIELAEREMDILTMYELHKRYEADIAEQCEGIAENLDKLRLELENSLCAVELEIKNAYLDVLMEGRRLATMKKSVAVQERYFKRLQTQYDLDMISEDALKTAELSLVEMKNQFDIAVYNYNTRIMKFNYAVGSGPAY